MKSKSIKQIRWTVEQAAREFTINPRTLANGLTRGSHRPGADGCFATRQICAAVFGDYELERAKLMTAKAAREEMALARERLELLPTELTKPLIQNIFFAVRRVIETSPLPNESKDRIYKEISSLSPRQIVDAAMAEAKKNAA